MDNNNKPMSLLKLWGELYEIHDETNRGGLVRALYRDKISLNAVIYYGTIILVALFTFYIFHLSEKSVGALLLLIPEIWVIYSWINLLIEKRYKKLCEMHNLKKYHFYQRQKLISYLLFSEKLNTSVSINKDDVELIVNWEKIENIKHDALSFFKEPVVLIVLTMTAGIFSNYIKIQIEAENIPLKAVLFFIFFALFFLWTFSDTMKTSTKINKEICQFLQWWKLDRLT